MENNLGKLAKAVAAVMKEVKGVEKNTTVGSGRSSYKGVSDKDVKDKVQDAMAKHGLCILPISVEPKTKIKRWEEEQTYQGNTTIRLKQNVFTEVRTKYLLLHESGESVELCGLGHGNDPADKAAGKATTYALKYVLLYTFLIPTGKIDDADNHHSEEVETPPVSQKTSTKKATPQQKPVEKAKPEEKNIQLPKLVKDSDDWKKIEVFNESGKLTALTQITKKFDVAPELQAEILQMIKKRENKEKNEGGKPNLDKETYDSAMRMRTPDKIQEILDGYEMVDDARKGLENKIKQLNKKE